MTPGLAPGVRGALIDVDGTLLTGERAIPGAAGALERLHALGIPFRLTTNTTRRSRSAVAGALRKAGFDLTDSEIVVPAILARRRILDSGRTRAALLVPESALVDFEGVARDEERPSWVVVGDIGRGFTWERLNRAFHWIRNGADILALHKNRCWDPGGGLVLDAGPFVVALEYATGRTAELLGKPSRAFFELALADLRLPARDVLVVGDDLEADCQGGAEAGCRTALVLTGKSGRNDLDRAGPRPDLVLESVLGLFDPSGNG